MSTMPHANWSRTPQDRPQRAKKQNTEADDFGPVLYRLRVERKLSQPELARRVGMHHAAISRLESGERMPPRQTVDLLAEGLDLKPGDHARLLMAAGYMPDAYRDVLEALIQEDKP